MVDKVNRIAIVDPERCKPKKCNQECRKSCPVAGGRCIEVTPKDVIALISEQLCIGCNRCTKTCPFGAIKIIKDLPTEMNSNMIHRYGANTFKLHRLPIPRPGQVLGLVGTNGIGKTSALRILSGKLKPNLGRFKNPPDWSEIRNHFRGSELQSYFTRLLEDNLKVFTKPQNIDDLRRKMKGTVRYYLDQSYYKERVVELCNDLELNEVLDRKVCNLSGGEIQRFAIAVTAATKADIYMIDEPSNYLDVRQKMKAAQVIRSLLTPTTYVIVVEHDLSVLDYMSDFVCCLYGVPTAYGVVTSPFSVREGINVFLAGFIPTENQRFRKEALSFKVSETPQGSADEVQSYARYKYPHMCKTRDEFKLCVMDGEFTDSQILVMLGENGTGKTTFIRMLANKLKPDSKVSEVGLPKLTVSHKTQEVRFDDEESTVRDLLYRIPLNDRQFNSDVMKPLLIDTLMDRKLGTLSGGESQRVALCMCLGKPADIYLIDEPSASLDSEQRFIASKVIKRFILHAKKTAFVVEHDLGMATYLADRVIVFEGKPSVDCTANSPEAVSTGMNRFLSKLGITFRRDPVNHRPRVNKMGSNKDQEQKLSGRYFHLDD